ncbi:MAG TPA: hypothetical protein GX506_07430 [Firmicutes bacterium]|nr:hypothetical protein [Bacillota bacterium]
MITILEYIWATNWGVILRLIALGLLDEHSVEFITGTRFARHDADLIYRHYEQMMRAPAYRRARGGAMRQVRWA